MSRHGSTLCSPTVEKILCRSPFRSGHMSAICARLSKGKVGVQRGRETAGVPSFLPPAAGAATSCRPQTANPPAEVQRKTSRPLGTNTPAAVRVPRSAGAEKPPARFAFPRLPYTAKTKKAPLTRCLSLLRICRPLSSSSCRNYRSRRRYYHHRYRRNHSRRCPDRSIPRSG